MAAARGALLPDLGVGFAAVGLTEAAANLAGGSIIDRLGDVAVANTPLPLVEETIKRLGITDKPFLRANLAVILAAAIGLAAPGRRPARSQLALAAVGAGAAALGRRHLARIEGSRRDGFELPPIAEPLAEIRDGAESWLGSEPLFTDPDRFYQTDINLRPPAVDAASWSLSLELPGGSRRLGLGELLAMELRERDAVLACVHNRPGWDRLGQQRWTGLPIAEVLERAAALPDHPERFDLVNAAADGYSQVIPLAEALERRTWLVLGMGGRALPREHGFPARLMTPGIVGQYNGVKWLDALRVVPRGAETSWWGKRRIWFGEPGWPRGLVEVKPMARIDQPANTGMPPRLPPPPVRADAGRVSLAGTAWAPPVGVAAVEVRVDRGGWRACELAAEINGDSWRRWRADLELAAGKHLIEARCHGGDGTVQAGRPREPFPHGSGAFHAVSLTAE